MSSRSKSDGYRRDCFARPLRAAEAVFRTSDFRLTFAKRPFKWAGEGRAGLPIMRWPDRTICEPLTIYFGYSVEKARVAISSLKDEAYILREWFTFLANLQVPWEKADDLLLRRWRQSFASTKGDGKRYVIKKARIERKLQVVFDFYRFIPEAMPFTIGCEPRLPTVGSAHLITHKESDTLLRKKRMVWSGSERAPSGSGARPTPDEAEVARVLAWLRGKPVRSQTGRLSSNARLVQTLEGERNWLGARMMAEAGLRPHEAVSVCVGDIAAALRNASIQLPPGGLGAVAGDPEQKKKILDALKVREAQFRPKLFVVIEGKGGHIRKAPFTVDLMCDILEIGIWTVRHRQLEMWHRTSINDDALLLSFSTHRRLEPGSLGDLLSSAFSECKVNGSAHRLRAHFATLRARDLLERNAALFGFVFNDAVKNLTLSQLAEELGHAQVTTSVKNYIDAEMLRMGGATRRNKTNALGRFWQLVTQLRNELPAPKLDLLGHVAEALSKEGDEGLMSKLLTKALAHPAFMRPAQSNAPSMLAAKPISKPNLKLVD